MAQLILLDKRIATALHTLTCDCGFAITGRSTDAVYAGYEEHLHYHEVVALASA